MQRSIATVRKKRQNSTMKVDTDKIARLRKELGLSIRDAADRADMKNRNSWYSIESGDRSAPSIDMLNRIGRVLGVDGIDLLKRS